MEINQGEVYSIISALEARKEWVEDDVDSGCENELFYLESALNKFKELKQEIKLEK